jgi:hypothetical protein
MLWPQVRILFCSCPFVVDHATASPTTATSLPSSSATQFEFVDAFSSSSRTLVQKHSMRHYLRQKRLRDIEVLRSSAPVGLQWQVRQPVDNERVSPGREKVTIEDILSDKSPLIRRNPSPSALPVLRDDISDLHVERLSSRNLAGSEAPSPRTAVCSKKKQGHFCLPEPCNSDSLAATPFHKPSISIAGLSRKDNQQPPDHVPTHANHYIQDLQGFLDAGKMDPFNTYPIKLDRLDVDLMDYCKF